MKISVVTTLFNYSRFIQSAVESFVKQNFPDSEMIIVDDASTDSPLTVLRPLLNNRIRYIKLDDNMGYSYAKNIGIKESQSEIIAMLDADDMLTNDSLELRYNKIMEGYDFVHGPTLDYLENGKLKKSKLWVSWMTNKGTSLAYKYVHAQAVMLKKDIHRKIGLYDESLRCKSDREMWARVFNHGFKVGCVRDYVAMYRIHADQMHRSPEKLAVNKSLQREVEAKIKKRKDDLSGIIMLEG